MIEGVDYSFARPTPASLVAAGKSFVCRYLEYSHATAASVGKFLTAAELASLRLAGLAVVANFESTSTRALDGAAAGSADGTDARVAAQALGFPPTCAIYASVDTGLTPSQYPTVLAYMLAFETALGDSYRLGLYGGSLIRDYLAGHGLHLLFWQSAALSWSGGVWDPTAHIQQRGTGSLAGTDADQALLADYGQWAAPGLPDTSTGGDMPIYSRGGTWLADVPADTPYYTEQGDTMPRAHNKEAFTGYLTAFSVDGKRVAVDGEYAGAWKSTPQQLGWFDYALLKNVRRLPLADPTLSAQLQAADDALTAAKAAALNVVAARTAEDSAHDALDAAIAQLPH